MGYLHNLTDKRFGRLLVKWPCGRHGRARGIVWLCLCDCGRLKHVTASNLKTINVQSCGCIRGVWHRSISRLKWHGQTPVLRHGTTIQRATSAYNSWLSMWRRCCDPLSHNYKYYGELGVTVCARWQDFGLFTLDVGQRPKGKTLDRRDTYGDYTPTNWRWATPKEQANNRRRHV